MQELFTHSGYFAVIRQKYDSIEIVRSVFVVTFCGSNDNLLMFF